MVQLVLTSHAAERSQVRSNDASTRLLGQETGLYAVPLSRGDESDRRPAQLASSANEAGLAGSRAAQNDGAADAVEVQDRG